MLNSFRLEWSNCVGANEIQLVCYSLRHPTHYRIYACPTFWQERLRHLFQWPWTLCAFLVTVRWRIVSCLMYRTILISVTIVCSSSCNMWGLLGTPINLTDIVTTSLYQVCIRICTYSLYLCDWPNSIIFFSQLSQFITEALPKVVDFGSNWMLRFVLNADNIGVLSCYMWAQVNYVVLNVM